MDREILFRGKRIDNGEWVEGYLLIGFTGIHYIIKMHDHILGITEMYEVDPSTIGQYTGLSDKNGAKIFEGDILRFPPKKEWDKDNFEGYEVFWHDNDCCDRHVGWQMNRLHFYGALCGKDIGFVTFKPEYVNKMEVIGNIYNKHNNKEG